MTDWEPITTIRTVGSDGIVKSLLRGAWPKSTAIDDGLMDGGAAALIVEGDQITIRLDNASAVYRITERQPHLGRVIATLESEETAHD